MPSEEAPATLPEPVTSPRRTGKKPTFRPYTMGPKRSYGVPVTYLILLALLAYAYEHGAAASVSVFAFAGVAALVLLYLGRELSVRYLIDRKYLRAWRLFGTRKVRLSQIRKVELASLRDLSPSGFTGTWGWRSRVWSPQVGKFDSIHTSHVGMLVHGDGVPLFISPRDRDQFLRALVERVRRTNPTVESPLDAPTEPPLPAAPVPAPADAH